MSTRANPDVHNEFEPAKEADKKLFEELRKDVGEMDVSVIEEAIRDFTPVNSDAECAKMLDEIKHGKRRKRIAAARRGLVGTVATVIFLLAVSDATYNAANAFQIESVLQFFSAFGELFSYESLNAGDAFSIKKEAGEPVIAEGAWLDEEESNEMSFDSAEAFLQAVDLYPEGFAGLLARYTFETAILNDDGAFYSYMVTLRGADAETVYVRCIRQRAEDASISYFYENDEEQITETWIDGVKIVTAPNYEVSAIRWSQDHLHVDIWGGIPEYELLELAKIMLGASQ